MATGAPNPAAPSMNAPNEKATRTAWSRRSPERLATEAFMISNWPVVTAMSYRNTAATISQTTRKTAKTNPTTALARIIFAGMPKTKKAMTHAVDKPGQRRPGGVQAAPGQQTQKDEDWQGGRQCGGWPVPQGIVTLHPHVGVSPCRQERRNWTGYARIRSLWQPGFSTLRNCPFRG